jgi:hypothetical protein
VSGSTTCKSTTEYRNEPSHSGIEFGQASRTRTPSHVNPLGRCPTPNIDHYSLVKIVAVASPVAITGPTITKRLSRRKRMGQRPVERELRTMNRAKEPNTPPYVPGWCSRDQHNSEIPHLRQKLLSFSSFLAMHGVFNFWASTAEQIKQSR